MVSIKKQKKITIKFFLNRLVAPVQGTTWNRNGSKRDFDSYPLYIQVTYNRKNTQFTSKYGEYYENLNEIKPGLMEFEEKVIRKIIEHEATHNEEFDLKGLKHKYEVYSTSVISASEYYLIPKIRSAIQKTRDELGLLIQYHYPHSNIKRLHKAAQLLFKGFDKNLQTKFLKELNTHHYFTNLWEYPSFTFDFATLIDWLDGSYPPELEKLIKSKYKNKPEILKDIIKLIDESVNEYLKKLG